MSQALAKEIAQKRGVELLPVMATIEAETNFRNVLGEYDAPSAKWGGGFGQVHPAWHEASVRAVASRLGVALPVSYATIPFRPGQQPWDLYPHDKRAVAIRYILDEIILKNDVFSMELAVEVIGKKWKQTGSFESFQKAYVGQKISQRDLNRRRKIWERWEEKLNVPAVVPPAPAAEQPDYEKIGIAVVSLLGLLVASLAIKPK